MPKTEQVNLDECASALARILAAVVHKDKWGCFPSFPGDKSFERWAGDLAAKALRCSEVADLDKFI